MDFLRSAVIRVTLASALVALPAAAAPGAFTLTGTPSCSVLAPAIVFQWTPSFGATSYELIRDDGQYYLFLSLDEEHVSGERHLGDDVKASGAFTLADMPRRRAATH